MPNALSTPAPPEIGNTANVNGNALSMGGPPQATPGQPKPAQQPAPPPAPTHQQTVAALRHFAAIKTELTTLLKDPDIGKVDAKSRIVDGVTTLVANGIVTPVEAVDQLATVPKDNPFQQKVWLEQHLSNAIQGANAILDHHRAAFAGMPVDETIPDPAQHGDVISALVSKYKGQANGRR